MIKATAKMKAKISYWQHQEKDGSNYKVNDILLARPDIDSMIDKKIGINEATIATDTTTTTTTTTTNTTTTTITTTTTTTTTTKTTTTTR